jgi:hypothetical protein
MVEDETNEMRRKILRAALQAHFSARGDGDVGKALVAESRPAKADGNDAPDESSEDLVPLSHRQSRHRAYKSRFGWIDADRFGLQEPW